MYCWGDPKGLKEEIEEQKGRNYGQCTQWFGDSHVGSRSRLLIDQSLKEMYACERVVMAIGILFLSLCTSSYSFLFLIPKSRFEVQENILFLSDSRDSRTLGHHGKSSAKLEPG